MIELLKLFADGFTSDYDVKTREFKKEQLDAIKSAKTSVRHIVDEDNDDEYDIVNVVLTLTNGQSVSYRADKDLSLEALGADNDIDLVPAELHFVDLTRGAEKLKPRIGRK